MITITENEEMVLNKIKLSNNEIIDFDTLKNDLDIREYNLNEVLNSLASKKLIKYSNNSITFIDSDKKINVVKSNQEIKNLELNIKEQQALELIKNSVDENNLISRYILEGSLLYGDLELTDFRMHNIILSLENKGLLELVKKEDGDYYSLI